jgi:hypothetical protein
MFDKDGQLLVEPNLSTVQALVLLQSIEMLAVYPWAASTKYDSTLLVLWYPYRTKNCPLYFIDSASAENPRRRPAYLRGQQSYPHSCAHYRLRLYCDRPRMCTPGVLGHTIDVSDCAHVILRPYSPQANERNSAAAS